MRVHDWTKVSRDEFHSFHQTWSVMLSGHLNQLVLPAGYYSQIRRLDFGSSDHEFKGYHRIKNRVLIFETQTYGTPSQREVAIVEFVYPGDKGAPEPLNVFVNRIVDGILAGTHFLIVDVFPPTRWAPTNIHDSIWSKMTETEQHTSSRPLLQISYASSKSPRAYVEPIQIGGELASMPLFLNSELFVNAPLQVAYADAFNGSPRHVRQILEQ
jgi:hypothetical protein